MAVARFAFDFDFFTDLAGACIGFNDDGSRFRGRGDLGRWLRSGLFSRLLFFGLFLLIGDRFVELFFLDDVFLLRSSLRLLFLLLGRLGRFLLLWFLFRCGAIAGAAGGFDLDDRAADLDRVAFATRILMILPACGLGTGMVALSVSTSRRSWLAFVTTSPSLTRIERTSPDSIFSPRMGSLIWVDIIRFRIE